MRDAYRHASVFLILPISGIRVPRDRPILGPGQHLGGFQFHAHLCTYAPMHLR